MPLKTENSTIIMLGIKNLAPSRLGVNKRKTINTIKTNGIRTDCEPLASNQLKKLSDFAPLRDAIKKGKTRNTTSTITFWQIL